LPYARRRYAAKHRVAGCSAAVSCRARHAEPPHDVVEPRLDRVCAGRAPSSTIAGRLCRQGAVEPRVPGALPALGRRAWRGRRIFRRWVAEDGYTRVLHGDTPKSTAPGRLFRYPAVASPACLGSAARRRRVTPARVFAGGARYSASLCCLVQRFAIA